MLKLYGERFPELDNAVENNFKDILKLLETLLNVETSIDMNLETKKTYIIEEIIKKLNNVK